MYSVTLEVGGIYVNPSFTGLIMVVVGENLLESEL